MSENGVMDRPRRTTRSSLASSAGGTTTPATPTSSSNPYKKPTYYSSTRGGGETPVSSRNTNGTTPSSGRGRRGRGRPPGRSSMSGGRGGGNHHHHHHTKPECIAVRVDGRRSTGGSTASSGGGRRGAVSSGRRSTYSSRHEYDYHYGSDFESDHDSEPEDEEEVESEQEDSDAESVSLAENDNAESDSDFSVSSTRVTSSRLPSPPVPIWLDTDKVPEIPKLELPNSSEDLLLSREHVVKAVEIYEPLRRFYQLVRLSPFRFEDFCGALASEDQSSLLAEIHIQLLKSVIREEDANGTQFGPNEVKDSVQAIVYFIDYITWPETLRSYLESDSAWKDVYDELVSVEYPFCGPAIRIKVLGWLVDQFLTTNAVREQLLGDGNILHEDHCRACNRLGELICCETCPAVYHLECITPPLKDIDNPPDDWKCPVCTKHQIPGVNECVSELEKVGCLIRHERLGYDRHGRKYWFLVRRLLVESEDGSEVWYYSTQGQIEELLTRLDANTYENILVSNIKAIEEELYRQMEVTEEVTRLQNTHRRKTYLEVENGKEETDGGAERVTRLKSSGLFKLGQEGLFRQYINLFTTEPAALSKGKQNEERDRKRHMSHKFSLTPASECKYGIKDMGGCPRTTQLQALRGALTHMENALPTTLMHVNWPMLRKTWLSTIQTGASAADFSQALIMISACIRTAVYNPVWSESSGHVRFIRMSLLEREERKKSEKREKKDKDDEEERLRAVTQFIKYTLPIRHQVYKQKGEEYRLHGRWGWIWLSNLRKCQPQDCRKMGLLAGPHKHVIQVKNDTGKVKTMLIDPSVYNKLMAKRNMTVASNNVPSSQHGSEGCDAVGAPAIESTSTVVKPEDTNVESKPTLENSSEDSKVAAESNDVEMKEAELPTKAAEVEEEQQKAKSPEDVKVESTEVETTSLEKQENDEEDIREVGVGSPKTEAPKAETSEEKVSEVKVEPMEVEVAEAIESQSESKNAAEKMDEDSKNEELEDKNESNGNGIPSEEKAEETATEEMADEGRNTDEECVTNGTAEGEDSQTEKGTVEDKKNETEVQTVNDSTTAEAVSQSHSIDSGVEATQSSTASSSTVPMTPDKQDDSQIRKFKSELINVSSGLASAHRLLYPKVARRCDYLDSMLQRRLTLLSLEDKQLRSTYGEEMVNKAKTGIIQFEEEEKKRKQEEDEYPGEEVIDQKLILGGAYKFCCYSSECRKEALLFMKGKGKNRERLYEKICYSPMCRLKFCLQETTRMKQERMREMEREKYYKVYKEIEEKRTYTREGTSHKVVMKKLPECLTVAAVPPAAGGVPAIAAATAAGSQLNSKKKKTTSIKYPQTSSFRYSTSQKPSILVLPPYELKKLSRTAGRHFTPSGFLQNQKSGSWGWPYPCGRPIFRTAWQYRTAHANTLAAAAMQLKILYASIKWDDIVAKIPNTEGKHQVHTDTEIITTEILSHRIVGRFLERVQYLRKMMVVPIDAPKTIREITPSRIGLRKRKRAESPDKTEPVVSEDWVDEERLELWEIRYYGDRIDRKHDRRSESNTPSTRTKSGIAIKQPEKYDPSHHPTPSEKKTYPAASHQQNASQVQPTPNSTAAGSTIGQDSLDKTIEHVVRSHDAGKSVSAVKTAELMRETIETELKMQKAVHISKRDSHSKNTVGQKNGANQTIGPTQPTAFQQFQQQQLQQQQTNGKVQNGSNPQQRNIAQIAVTNPTGKVQTKKFFPHRQSSSSAATSTVGADAAILTKQPHQNTITINKAAIAKNTQAQQLISNPVVSQAVAVANAAVTNTQISQQQYQQQLNVAALGAQLQSQKLSVVRLPDGRVQVKGLLPGQTAYQSADGKIHVTVSASAMQQLQQQIMAGKSVQGHTQITGLPGSGATNEIIPQAPQHAVVVTAPNAQAINMMSAVNTPMPLSAPQSVAVSSMGNTVATSAAQQMTESSQQNHTGANEVMQNAQTHQVPDVNQQQMIVTSQQQSMSHQGVISSNSSGAAAQAVLQQHQQLQQQKMAQTSQQVASVVATTSMQQVTAGTRAPVIVSSSGSTLTSPATTPMKEMNVAGGRVVFQDGKQIFIGSPTAVGQQQKSLVVGNKVLTGVPTSQSSVRPATPSQGQTQSVQVFTDQDGKIHMIPQQHVVTSTASGGSVQMDSQKQAGSSPVSFAAANNVVSNAPVVASSAPALVASPAIVSVTSSAGPSTPKINTISASGNSTPVKLTGGRTILLSQDQINYLQAAGNRKILLNSKSGIATSTSAVRNLPQIVQHAGMQILQCSNGQHYIINPGTQQAVLQQGQQQVQLVVPSNQLGQQGQQHVVIKKIVKTTPAATNQAGPSGIVARNVFAVTGQNQIAQLVGPNKAIVRVDSNQQASAISVSSQQLISQPSTPNAVAVSSSPVATQQTPLTSIPSGAAATQIQQQPTTITRTPGLPISIVSPSKAKVQQVTQKSPITSPTVASSSVQGSTPTTTPTIQRTTPTVLRTLPTVLRPPSTPTITKSQTPSAVASSPKPLVASAASPPAPKPVVAQKASSTVVSAVPFENSKGPHAVRKTVIAVKSSPPPIPAEANLGSLTLPVEQPQNELASPSTAPVPTAAATATKSETSAVQSAASNVGDSAPNLQNSVPSTPSTPAGPVSAPNAAASAAKPKASPSKIVAQIFQTPQGPKVVIQGVNPGDLTPNQMAQLQAQIQKQLAAQQVQKGVPGNDEQQQQQQPVGEQVNSSSIGADTSNQVSAPATLTQSPAAIPQHMTNSALQSSPIEVLRSSFSTPVSQSHPITSPVLARSPPVPTMVSPAKVLSPPANLPNVLSKSSGFPAIPVNNSVPSPLTSPVAPPVVARKSQSRKSPIRPNNIDSPPHIFSPSSPVPSFSSPPPARNNWNSNNDTAAELMKPLSPEQQQLLAERRHSLKEDIMEKKKQAAHQMRLDAQREIELAKARAIQVAKTEEEKRTMHHHQQHSESFGGRGKKRKLDSPSVESNSRSSDGSGSGHVVHHKKGPKGRGGGGRKRKLFCICKTPYDSNRFYVGCDKCQNWFHGDCIGITEEMSRDLPEYICDDCKEDKLYCYCRKPYNESQFYIQCDKCDDWFHGRCVGILQNEADSIGDYKCPTCDPGSVINLPNSKHLDARDYELVTRLMKEIIQHRSSAPFRKPVTRAQAPNYFAIIKEPMDFQTIQQRVDERHYAHLRDFIGDVSKIFENCRYFNDKSTDIYRHADTLEKYCVQKIEAVRATLKTRIPDGIA